MPVEDPVKSSSHEKEMSCWIRGGVRIATLMLLGLASCSSQPPAAAPTEPVKKEATETKVPAPVTAEPATTPGRMWEGKTLLMHYMPWYETPQGRGNWGSHWTGHEKQHDPEKLTDRGLPDIWSHYHPLIGLYDSADPDLLECHLLQMKLAGIDGVIVDWYGIMPEADYPQIQEATQAMFAACGKFGMQFAPCFEDRSVDLMLKWKKLTEEQVPAHLTETFQWMEKEWFSQPQMARRDGKPLVLVFGPIYVQNAEFWRQALGALKDKPALFGLHHLWRKAAADGGFTWVHFDAWAGNHDTETVKKRLQETYAYPAPEPNQVIPSAVVGFDDVYAQSHGRVEAREGQTLRESLEVCMEGPWPQIQLVTWNDYGEGTMFEPTHEHGYRSLEIVQEARKKEGGGKFPFAPEDLRLPARLYALRKKVGTDPAVLDKISDLLRSGKCAEAKQALDGLAPADVKPAS